MLTLKSAWVILLVAVSFVLGITAVEAKVLESQTKRFYITLDGDGANKTIALFDPFRIFVQCQVNRNGKDKIKIFLKSTAGGWFVNDRNGPLAAGRVVLFSEDETTGEAEYTDDDGKGSAAAENGCGSRKRSPRPTEAKSSGTKVTDEVFRSHNRADFRWHNRNPLQRSMQYDSPQFSAYV
jgi:hypothetical protein